MLVGFRTIKIPFSYHNQQISVVGLRLDNMYFEYIVEIWFDKVWKCSSDRDQG